MKPKLYITACSGDGKNGPIGVLKNPSNLLFPEVVFKDVEVNITAKHVIHPIDDKRLADSFSWVEFRGVDKTTVTVTLLGAWTSEDVKHFIETGEPPVTEKHPEVVPKETVEYYFVEVETSTKGKLKGLFTENVTSVRQKVMDTGVHRTVQAFWLTRKETVELYQTVREILAKQLLSYNF